MNRSSQRGATVVGVLIVVSLFGLAVGIGARILSSSASQTYCGQGRVVSTIPGGEGGSETMSAPCGDTDTAVRRTGPSEPADPGGAAEPGAFTGRGGIDIGEDRVRALESGPFSSGEWDARSGNVFETGTRRVWDPSTGEVFDDEANTITFDPYWISPELAADPSIAPPRPPVQGFGTLEAWEPRWYDNPYAAGALKGLGVSAISGLLGMTGWEGASNFARDVDIAADRPEGRDTEFVFFIGSLATEVFTGGSRLAARGAARGATRLMDDVAEPVAAAPRLTGAARLAPDLRAQIDALAEQGDYFVIPNGTNKDGLIDFLRTKPIEYAVARSAEDGLLYVIRGDPAWVIPRSPNDRLIFHNHPNNVPIISGVMRHIPDQFGRGDWAWVVRNRHQQRSTVIGTETGTFRQRMPRSWEMFEWDSVARDWRRTPFGAPIPRQPRLDNLVIGGTMARDRRTNAYFQMLDAFEQGKVEIRDVMAIQDLVMDGTRLRRTDLSAAEAVYLGYAGGQRTGSSIVTRLENGVEIRFEPIAPPGSALDNPLGVERFRVEVRVPDAQPRVLDDVEVVLDGNGRLIDVQLPRATQAAPTRLPDTPGPSAPSIDVGRGSQYRSDAIDSALAESFAQPINPVVLPAARLADATALMAGGGQIVDGQLVVNGRTYGLDQEGVIAPIAGPGIVELDRDSYVALGVYNELGPGSEAEAKLDQLSIGEASRRRALGVHDLNADLD